MCFLFALLIIIDLGNLSNFRTKTFASQLIELWKNDKTKKGQHRPVLSPIFLIPQVLRIRKKNKSQENSQLLSLDCYLAQKSRVLRYGR